MKGERERERERENPSKAHRWSRGGMGETIQERTEREGGGRHRLASWRWGRGKGVCRMQKMGGGVMEGDDVVYVQEGSSDKGGRANSREERSGAMEGGGTRKAVEEGMGDGVWKAGSTRMGGWSDWRRVSRAVVATTWGAAATGELTTTATEPA